MNHQVPMILSSYLDFAHFWKLKHFLNSKVFGEPVDVFVVGDSACCCECSQVGAALRPAFSADASPDVTAKACQVTINTSLYSLYCSADPAVTEVQRGSAGGTVRYCWTGCYKVMVFDTPAGVQCLDWQRCSQRPPGPSACSSAPGVFTAQSAGRQGLGSNSAVQ